MITVTGVILGVFAAQAARGAGEPEMLPPVSFPQAGVRLAIPKGFEFVGTGTPREVATAVRKEGTRPVQSVTLAICLEDAGGSAAKLAEAVKNQIAQALDVRDLVVVKDAPGKVAGQEALVRHVTYTSRGQKLSARMACWLRPREDGAPAIGYVLTATSFADKAEGLAAVLEQVAGSVATAPMGRPAELPIEALGEAIALPAGGYSLRRPHGWYRVPVGGAVAMAQWDYLADSETVRTWVVSQAVAKGTTPRQRADAVMATKTPEVVSTVVAQSPARMGGQEGYQFMVRLAPAAPASRPASAPGGVEYPLVVQRIICVSGAGKDDRCFSLFLFYQGADVKAAAAMMDKIAEGFALAPAATAASAPGGR